MTTVEAAQAWAEAKETKEKTLEALRAAEQAYEIAQAAEFSCWKALEAMADRQSPLDKDVEIMAPLNDDHPLVQQARHYNFNDGFAK